MVAAYSIVMKIDKYLLLLFLKYTKLNTTCVSLTNLILFYSI